MPPIASAGKLIVVLYLALSMLVSQSGCTTTRQLQVPQSSDAHELPVGKSVVVVLRSGKKFKGTVREVTDRELLLDQRRIALQDIREINVRQANPAGTVALVAGLIWLSGHLIRGMFSSSGD